MPRRAWIALIVVILTALPFLLDWLGAGLLLYFGCDVSEGNLSDCAMENRIVLPLIGLRLLFALAILILPLSYLALLVLGGCWLVTRYLPRRWWPVTTLAGAVLVSLGMWAAYIM